MNAEQGRETGQVRNTFRNLMNDPGGAAGIDARLAQTRAEMRENSSRLRADFADFVRRNASAEGIGEMQNSLWFFLERSNALSKRLEECMGEQVAHEKNLKVRVVSMALHVSENNDNLKKAVLSLTKQVADIGQAAACPAQEVYRLRKIVSKKETAIQGLRERLFQKSHYYTLRQLNAQRRDADTRVVLEHLSTRTRTQAELLGRVREAMVTLSNPALQELVAAIETELNALRGARPPDELLDSRLAAFPPVKEQSAELLRALSKFKESEMEIMKNKDMMVDLTDSMFCLRKEVEELKAMKTNPYANLIADKENEINFSAAKIRELEEINTTTHKKLLIYRQDFNKQRNLIAQRLKLAKFVAHGSSETGHNVQQAARVLVEAAKAAYFPAEIGSARLADLLRKYRGLYGLRGQCRVLQAKFDALVEPPPRDPKVDAPKKEEEKPVEEIGNKSRARELQELTERREKTINSMNEVSRMLQEINSKMVKEVEERQRIQEDNKKMSLTLTVMKDRLKSSFDQLQQLEAQKERLSQTLSATDEKLLRCVAEIEEKRRSIERIRAERESMKKRLAENEEQMAEKDRQVRDLTGRLGDVQRKNSELKASVDAQLLKMEAIVRDSFAKYQLLEDLQKQKRVFDQIFKHQTEKIKLKEERIKSLENKLSEIERAKNGVPKHEPLKRRETLKTAYEELKDLQAKASEFRTTLMARDEELQRARQDAAMWRERVEVEAGRLRKATLRVQHLERVEIPQFRERIMALSRLIGIRGEDSQDDSNILKTIDIDSAQAIRNAANPKSFELIGYSIRQVDVRLARIVERQAAAVRTIFDNFQTKTTAITTRLATCRSSLTAALKAFSVGHGPRVEQLREHLRKATKRNEELSTRITELEHKSFETLESHSRLMERANQERDRLMCELIDAQKASTQTFGFSHRVEDSGSSSKQMSSDTNSLRSAQGLAGPPNQSTPAGPQTDVPAPRPPAAEFSFKNSQDSMDAADVAPKKFGDSVNLSVESESSDAPQVAHALPNFLDIRAGLFAKPPRDKEAPKQSGFIKFSFDGVQAKETSKLNNPRGVEGKT